MDDDGAVAEEGTWALGGGEVEVEESGVELVRGSIEARTGKSILGRI